MRVLSHVLTRWFIVQCYSKKPESFTDPGILHTVAHSHPSWMDKRLAKDIVNLSLGLGLQANPKMGIRIAKEVHLRN